MSWRNSFGVVAVSAGMIPLGAAQAGINAASPGGAALAGEVPAAGAAGTGVAGAAGVLAAARRGFFFVSAQGDFVENKNVPTGLGQAEARRGASFVAKF